MTSQPPDAERLINLDFPLDLRRTLEPLAHGQGDPTLRLSGAEAWLAFRTPEGPATLHLNHLRTDAVAVHAWGSGAEPALARAERLIGTDDDPAAFEPRHRLLHELQRRFRGLRLTASGRPFDALLPTVLEQKVTGIEARASYRRLIHRHGEPAPGSFGLRLPPDARTLAALPYYAYHPLGVERRRADVIRRVAAVAPRLQAAASSAAAQAVMGPLAGIGPWTIAEVVRNAYGDPDAISVGDYHLPHIVAWALAGEARATDERMLELLEPYCGQRARVQRLLEVSGIQPPRYGPRMTPRNIAAI